MDQQREVVSEGYVWKEIIVPGESRISEKPTEGATCFVEIANIRSETAEDKSESRDLENTLKEQNTKILTGNSQVELVIGEGDCSLDRRIEMAIKLMKLNEKSRITISLQDPTTGIETSKVSFEAKLSKHDICKPIWEWTPQYKYEIAMRYKNMGVELFKESGTEVPRYKDAFYRFGRACKILITLEPIQDLELEEETIDKIQALRIKLYNNMAACQGKHNNYYHVIELCSKVLTRDDNNTLALFRRGYAHGELKDYERAVEDFAKVVRLEPTNKQAILKLQQYRSCLRQAHVHCNEMIKRMFK